MPVPSVVDDEPRRRDDPRALQYGVDEWEVRPAELVGEKPVDMGWAASAYVVCTLIEQRILGFTPKPVLERLMTIDDIVNDDVSLAVSIGDIESEIAYLQSTTEETQHG
jgi:hypothetical protein